MSIERHLVVSNDDADDLTGALAWAVQCVDTEFVGATMVRVTVEQTMQSTTGDPQWRYVWSASVSGCVSEGAPTG